MENPCHRPMHPQASEGIRLFNRGAYFEAHEALEDAWNDESGPIRHLYRGILQTAVVYLHITRGNFPGAVKVYKRSLRWLAGWPDSCQGIDLKGLRTEVQHVMDEVNRLGREGIASFDRSFLKPIRLGEAASDRIFTCDRCGHKMYEHNCKVTCPNCGNRFDCSDLNLYFD